MFTTRVSGINPAGSRIASVAGRIMLLFSISLVILLGQSSAPVSSQTIPAAIAANLEGSGELSSEMSPVILQEETFKFEYAAKIVCGIQRNPKDMRLARGFYATTINIHNPNREPVRFFKKLALTFPPKEQKPGKILPISTDTLRYDEALKVDCNEIETTFFPNGFPTAYIEGFVIIQSEKSLDVTAVYTTAELDKKGRVTQHSSIDVEQIRERRNAETPCLADLIVVPNANGSFCKRVNGTLIITVKNQGQCAAAETRTVVDFPGFGSFSLPTPALAPGATVDLSINIPGSCFNPDCEFKITVDASNGVLESNEGNNTVSDFCLG